MTEKGYEYCPKCGCIVGEYIIREGMGGIGVTQNMFCDNYCRVCGEKIDAIGFKNKVDKLAKDIIETNKQIEDLRELYGNMLVKQYANKKRKGEKK